MIKASVDLSSKFGSIRNQGMRSTCLACAASDVHAAARKASPLSAEYLFYHAAQKQLPVPHENGLYLNAVSQAISVEGQCLESSYPYLQNHGIAAPLPLPANPFPHPTHIAKVQVKADNVAKLLGAGITPILVSHITRRFQYANPANDVVDFDPSDTRVGVHAVVAVAFGNSRDGRNFIKIRNSWGEKWGNQGHAWLSEEYVTKHVAQTAALQI